MALPERVKLLCISRYRGRPAFAEAGWAVIQAACILQAACIPTGARDG